tara:strand:+ start:4306 stop:4527 length:222 start_codon:yes stop_codon:yes gene_type:complete
MGAHSKGQVNDLKKRLTEAYKQVLTVMDGRDGNPGDPEADSKIERWIDGRDLRFALGHLEVAIKEIRAELGKR